MAEEILGRIKGEVTLDSKGFAQGVAQVDRQLRLLKSEFDASSAKVKAFGQSQDLLKNQAQILGKQIDLQKQKVALLAKAHEETSQKLGAESKQAQQLAISHNKAQAALSRLEGSLKKTNEQLNRQTSIFGQYNKSMFHIRDQAIETGAALGVMSTGFAVAFGSAVKKAADFEAQLSSIQAVTGASAQEMEQFRQLAIQMGASTKFSATEAEQGIEELAKAGVSTADILNGGLKGALDLAAAGELDLAEAAQIASTALNAFRADHLSVAQAANILAGAANASATDVKELNFGLSQVAAVASGVGLTFKDTATALAVFAQNGLRGSDAGTSLKTMLLNLTPSTKPAITEMKKLGIITKDGKNQFFDASGKLKSFADIAGILQQHLSGLTQQQRIQAMQTMFGTDAIRAANIAFKEGATGVRAMSDAMSKTTAAEVAAKRMDNLKGTIEQLRGSWETFQIQIGSAFLPVLKAVANDLNEMVDWFSKLSPSTKEAIGIFTAATAGVLALGAAVAGIVAIANPFTAAIVGIGTVLAGLIAINRKVSEDMKTTEENAIRFGYGVSQGTIQAAKGYMDLRDQAMINLAKLRTASGAEAKRIVDETVAIFGQMGDKIVANLNQDKINIQKAVASLLGKIPEVVRPGVESVEKEALKRIDQQIKQVQQANEIIRKGLVNFGGDVTKMPQKFAQSYQQALKTLDQSSKTFVKKVSDLDSYMKNITANQGKITAEGARNWVKEIQTAYNRATKAAQDWAKNQRATLEEAFANGEITKQQYDFMIQAVETGEQQMIDVAKNKRAQAIKELQKSLSDEANLYDLRTGEMLDRYQGYVTAKAGLMASEQETIERGKEINGEYFRSLIQDAAQSTEEVKKQKAALIQAYGDISTSMKQKLKVDLSAEGRQNIESLKQGMQSGIISLQQAASLIGLDIKSKTKVNLGPEGQFTVATLLAGLKSGKINIETFAKGIEGLLKTNVKANLAPEGKTAGDSHAKGLQSSKPNVQKAASDLKNTTQKTLGTATDGGGGRQAGSQFAGGIAANKGKAGSSASAVASAA
ncbi:phage tail tape measure protein, partial [Thermoactinomyces sp. CICC 10521]|uniref:phage tail tape measure protein n=1 Tax=Thermoactinomyces sp. CICC 10521 TaxID=2767426 RepID=UPI0018DBE1F1